MFKVFQIRPSQTVTEAVNSIGHSAAAQAHPIWEAKLETMHGSEGYKSQYSEHYEHVCDIAAEDLDAVFHIGNMGPEEKINRVAPMHSISVGDIVVDADGVSHMVDPIGFSPVEFSL